MENQIICRPLLDIDRSLPDSIPFVEIMYNRRVVQASHCSKMAQVVSWWYRRCERWLIIRICIAEYEISFLRIRNMNYFTYYIHRLFTFWFVTTIFAIFASPMSRWACLIVVWCCIASVVRTPVVWTQWRHREHGKSLDRIEVLLEMGRERERESERWILIWACMRYT